MKISTASFPLNRRRKSQTTPAFASSLAVIGWIRKAAGLRKLKELLEEMDIKAMLSEGWIDRLISGVQIPRQDTNWDVKAR